MEQVVTDLSIGIVGCGGRMGRTLLRQVTQTDGCTLAGGTEIDGHHAIGIDLGLLAGLEEPLNLVASADRQSLFETSDVIIDFTVPDTTALLAALAAETKTAHIVGTTGLDEDQMRVVTDAARRTVVVQAPNFSIGVNLLAALTRQVAQVLDPQFDIEILEIHHRHKVDAPSGTALALGHAAAEGRGVSLDNVADRARDGVTGARKVGNIGFASLRGGNVVGDHTVIFAADDERIELTHRAGDRTIFARGAVHAALWTQGKAPGYYTMTDVLGF
ncbi:MAG: 4-hydroxy-tetrahydrodipicolinate reductase [Alphaproteobacteria bacterium]|nr:MAG: 4-hydroxy-tetrahydrodipicolinate reductase [Alphaproteobacteria bacterium]